MNYKQTTQVPNTLFDLIPKLKPSYVLILLVVIRQTYGWYDSTTKKRKVRDWISYQQFRKKTGLSTKTIATAINYLVEHNLLLLTDKNGRKLSTPNLRQGKVRIFYQCCFEGVKKCPVTYVKKYGVNQKNLPITKLIPTKLTQQKSGKNELRRLSDSERIEEIFRNRNAR